MSRTASLQQAISVEFDAGWRHLAEVVEASCMEVGVIQGKDCVEQGAREGWDRSVCLRNEQGYEHACYCQSEATLWHLH